MPIIASDGLPLPSYDYDNVVESTNVSGDIIKVVARSAGLCWRLEGFVNQKIGFLQTSIDKTYLDNNKNKICDRIKEGHCAGLTSEEIVKQMKADLVPAKRSVKTWQSDLCTYSHYKTPIIIKFNLLKADEVRERQDMVCNFLKWFDEQPMQKNREPLKRLVQLMNNDFITSYFLKNKFYYVGCSGREDVCLREPLQAIQRDILRNRNGKKFPGGAIRDIKHRIIWPILTLHEFTGKCVENAL